MCPFAYLRGGILKRERAYVAQLAEHVLGKDEVSGSIPLVGSSFGREEKQGMLKEPNAGDGVEI